jgi:hypothetical protein
MGYEGRAARSVDIHQSLHHKSSQALRDTMTMSMMKADKVVGVMCDHANSPRQWIKSLLP